jgi:hypothetical protein
LLGFLCFDKEKGASRYVDSDKIFDAGKAQKDCKGRVRQSLGVVSLGVLFCLKQLLQR